MEGNIFEFSVDALNDGQRIDAVAAAMSDVLTRNRIQKLIVSGNVKVNGVPIENKNYKCSKNDCVSVLLPAPETVDICPENIPLEILFEDNDIIIVNKPKGMVVHPAAGHYSGTLVNALMYHCGGHLSGINGELRPGIVHRIDKDTSGVLVVCKNDTAHNYMADLLAGHRINRVYYCLVFGILPQKNGTIDKPIGRHPVDRKKMSVKAKNGKRAVTHYRVIGEYMNQYSLLECRLETGRTHQIRVHLSSIHYPLVGDTIYGREKQPFSCEGQMLHAAILGFVHPSTGNYMEFSAPLPEYFESICRKISCGSQDKERMIDELQQKLSGEIREKPELS